MARIPVPERGQPLDLSYMYQLASAVNDLSEELSTNTYNYLTVDTPREGRQSVKTSQAQIIGGYKIVVSNASVNAGDEQKFSYAFPNFVYPPIITATPMLIEDTPAGRGASVVIQSINNGLVEGIVKFGTNGVASIGINLIIVGIPSTI